MLTVAKNSDPEYYKSLLKSRDHRQNLTDYYADGAGVKEPPGRIYDPYGIFGLQDGAEPEENTLGLLVEGRDPHTGAYLPGLKRTGKNPGKQKKESKKNDNIRTESYDLTFNAPKSVGLLLAGANEEMQQKIIAAQEAAVRAAFDHFQEHLCRTRTGKDGIFIHRAQMAAIQFTQLDARPTGTKEGLIPSDPHLHTHNVIPNAVLYEKVLDDGTIIEECHTLDGQAIFNNQHTLGQIYKAELSEQLRQLGIKMRRTQVKGGYHSFEVEGFEPEIIDHFSKRTKEVLAERERMLAEGKSEKYANDFATTGSRQVKKEETLKKRDDRWKEELSSLGYGLDRIGEIAGDGEPIEAPLVTDDEIYQQFVDLIQTEAVIQHDDLWSAAADVYVGRGYGSADIHAAVNRIIESGAIIPLDDTPRGTCRYMPADLIVAQIELEQMTDELANTEKHPTLLSKEEAEMMVQKVSDDIAEELGEHRRPNRQQQKLAVNALSMGQLVSVEGGAGAGKTTAFDIVCRVLAERRPEGDIVGTAIANSVSKMLAEDLKKYDIFAANITLLLLQIEKGQIELGQNSVVLLDESSMVDVRQMAKLVHHVKASGARIILTGDRKQLAPVAAGHSLEILDKRLSEDQRFRLKIIQRQQDESEKAIVRALESGRSHEAINRLKKAKEFHLEYAKRNDLARHPEGGVAGTLEKVVTAYFDKVDNNPGETVGVFTPSNLEARELGARIRKEWRNRGALTGADRTVRAVTAAGETYDFSFAVGEKIVFIQTEKEIHEKIFNGAAGTITAIRGRSDRPEKMEVSVDFKTPEGVYSATFTLDKLMDEEKRVRMGWQYAATTHKGQGQTVDHSLISCAYGVNSMTRNMGYVLGSRHRKTQNWFVNAAAVRRSMMKDRGFRQRDELIDDISEAEVKEQIALKLATETYVQDAKHEFLGALDAQRDGVMAALDRLRKNTQTSSEAIRQNLDKLHAYATSVAEANETIMAVTEAREEAKRSATLSRNTEKQRPTAPKAPSAAGPAPKDEPEVAERKRQQAFGPETRTQQSPRQKSNAEKIAGLLDRRANQISRIIQESKGAPRNISELERSARSAFRKHQSVNILRRSEHSLRVGDMLFNRANNIGKNRDIDQAALNRKRRQARHAESYAESKILGRLRRIAKSIREDLSARWPEFDEMKKMKRYELLRVLEGWSRGGDELRKNPVQKASQESQEKKLKIS